MRIAALIAAALLWTTLSPAVPAAALTIGPPPPTGSSQASVRAYYEARLAQQEASYEDQIASLRRQLTAEKKQHAAADKTVSGLRLEAARSSASSEQVSALTAENEALKSDYASALQARAQQSYQIEELKGEIRPFYLDPLVWLVLVAGLGVGALVGLRVGFRRGGNRYLP